MEVLKVSAKSQPKSVAGAIAAVLAVPIVMGLAGRGAGTRAAMAAIIVQVVVLGVLDYRLGIEGACLWMLASGIATFAAMAVLERRKMVSNRGLEGV